MRYEVEVKDPFQWQCQVGDSAEMANGEIKEYTGIHGKVNTFMMQCFAAALGKVSRPIPLPDGYRFATEEDRNTGVNGSWWHPVHHMWVRSHRIGDIPEYVYAVPLTPSPSKDIPDSGVECEVDEVERGVFVAMIPSGSIQLKPGDKVRLVRVTEES